MAIAFARLEFVKRSTGKNACGKAAYNSRSQIEFQGTDWQESRTYDWSDHTPPAYHEVLLPENANSLFKSPENLWNAIEQKEPRSNSQTAFEMVLALPDDTIITLEDKKHLARTFTQQHFIQKGVAAQIDIHAPERKKVYSNTTQQYETIDHNWHAHILITTRRFKENGHLEDHKARDLMPIVRGGRVISGEYWGKLWAKHQNDYFEQKGHSLRVDPEGITPQRHLGPVRMRARALSLLAEHDYRLSLNTLEAQDPAKILAKITETKNIFTKEDIDQFLHKHTPPDKINETQTAFWKQPKITQLLEPKTNKPLNQFTTQTIIDEEKKILRLADRLAALNGHPFNEETAHTFASSLTSEQKTAFQNILNGQKLACIEGYAGTGKSDLLAALKKNYESQGYTVRGLGPDSATAHVLKDKGFSNAENVYRFLFAVHSGKHTPKKQEVWLLDEAGKLGNRPLLELLKCAQRHSAQVVLAGDSAQLPAVERGIGFKLISEKYGAQRLENIQRQHDKAQRTIAQKLAQGEMGQALDAIFREGSIHWRSTKEETIEALIKAWTQYRNSHPLIIAHSNREVKALNELARLYRRQAGELSPKEYQCETAYGTIYVSEGDRIELRKNDSERGVNNGTMGILIKATEKNFTLRIKEGSHTRHVEFDPRHYRSFQLAYATTYYRSQGRAAERVFVLHSPQMNKEMFYVGLTRHFKKVECFVSQQDAKNIADLKRQAYRQSFRPSICEYTTHSELAKIQAQADRKQQLNSLRESESLFDKTKGIGLSAWQEIRSKTSKWVEKQKDKQPDRSFFNPVLEKDLPKSIVKEVQFEKELHINDQKIGQGLEIVQKVDSEAKMPRKTQESTKKLSEEKGKLLKQYFKSLEHASTLHTIVKLEEENGNKSLHHQKWQKACGERNTHAFEIMNAFSKKELRALFNPINLDILQERASKHDQLNKQVRGLAELNARLTQNLDSLLFRLYPEGPTRQNNKGLRFGTKGALAISPTGSFYDFEKGEGGGPLQLIQKNLSCSRSEAIAWAKDFLGQAPSLSAPTQFSIPKEREQEWISLKPVTEAPTSFKFSNYKEKERYPYKDRSGEILFYTIRLEDESGSKIVLPLSYGYYKGNIENPTWSIKGYQAEKKPLYNLHLLQEFPKSNVLIVEGEKTANAASKMFPPEKMICLTWSGGAGAVQKSDWTPFFMRNVIIWPDNDKAGFEASNSICQELRRVGVSTLREVDRELLATNLPPKWDLADPLPRGINNSFIKDMILRAHEKAVGLKTLISHLKANEISVDVIIANTILSQVEERLRPIVEQKFGENNTEVKAQILTETLLNLRRSNQADYAHSIIKISEKVGETDIIIDRHRKDRGMER